MKFSVSYNTPIIALTSLGTGEIAETVPCARLPEPCLVQKGFDRVLRCINNPDFIIENMEGLDKVVAKVVLKGANITLTV